MGALARFRGVTIHNKESKTMTLHLRPTTIKAIWTLFDEFLQVDFEDRIEYLEANPEISGDLAQKLQHARNVIEEWRAQLMSDNLPADAPETDSPGAA
jgi:hypothetical protein